MSKKIDHIKRVKNGKVGYFQFADLTFFVVDLEIFYDDVLNKRFFGNVSTSWFLAVEEYEGFKGMNFYLEEIPYEILS